MTGEMFYELAKVFGLPMALLAILAYYHVGVLAKHAALVASKDEEIKRVNDLRVAESRDLADRSIERDEKTGAFLGELDKTIGVLAAHIVRG